jgi:hypothetical protein
LLNKVELPQGYMGPFVAPSVLHKKKHNTKKRKGQWNQEARSLFALSFLYHPITQELAALVNDGGKASIIEIPPCFSTSFVQVESRRGGTKYVNYWIFFSFNVPICSSKYVESCKGISIGIAWHCKSNIICRSLPFTLKFTMLKTAY